MYYTYHYPNSLHSTYSKGADYEHMSKMSCFCLYVYFSYLLKFFPLLFYFYFLSTKRRGPKQNVNLIYECRSCGLLNFRFRYPMLACMHVGKIVPKIRQKIVRTCAPLRNVDHQRLPHSTHRPRIETGGTMPPHHLRKARLFRFSTTQSHPRQACFRCSGSHHPPCPGTLSFTTFIIKIQESSQFTRIG